MNSNNVFACLGRPEECKRNKQQNYIYIYIYTQKSINK